MRDGEWEGEPLIATLLPDSEHRVASDMIQWEHHQQFDDECGRLAEEVTELGLRAEDVFKNATAALLDCDPQMTLSVIESADFCEQMRHAIHARALTLLTYVVSTPEDTRQLVELQSVAAAFAQISAHGRKIAEQALSLNGMGEMTLARIGNGAQELFVQMVRQVYTEMRACIFVFTSREMPAARRLISEDAKLDRLYQAFERLLNQEISRNPRSAAPLHRLLLVGMALEAMGNHAITICDTLLYRPPATM